jgi:fermentation-respiration switch protein FrsA (DUF1100 family)
MLQHLTIPRGPIELAADLHLPGNPDSAAPLRAVVVSTPGSSVKEQIGANYASRLAARGIAALVFDPAHQGQSGGEPRDFEDPYVRGEDISYAIDALGTIPGIDPRRIGVLGICAGGGYAVHTARTDHRIKAVATVVPGNMGTSFRSFQPDGPAAALDALADERIEETRSGEMTRVNWGGSEHSTNRRLSRSDSLLLGYDAFHLVDQLMTQPLQVILAGRIGNTGSYDTGMQLWKLAPNPVDLMVIDGAGHYEMYDEPAYVDAAVERLTSFYANNL